MLRLSANISLMYGELPFLDRVGAAAADGFTAVEVMYPYATPAADLADALAAHTMTLSVLNAPAGCRDAGELGFAALVERHADFQASIARAIDYALTTSCKSIHVLTGNLPPAISLDEVRPVLLTNLRQAAQAMASQGLTLLLEPLSRAVFPAYSLTRVEQAVALLDELDMSNAALQLDFYHTQMEQGHLANLIERHFERIAYVQIAGVPGRHQPTIGEINYHYLLTELERRSFAGWVGCEYIPQGATGDSLAWARQWGYLPRRDGG